MWSGAPEAGRRPTEALTACDQNWFLAVFVTVSAVLHAGRAPSPKDLQV